ncbi:unnamed protein product [Hermetia illucens]|uniref:Uncharacterized protein n=1 Tax=Hermetia illucens TaxID=343691 RepID=A0A7R8US94_HERIL|nr:unnamed protein product [Hermetia illucens]
MLSILKRTLERTCKLCTKSMKQKELTPSSPIVGITLNLLNFITINSLESSNENHFRGAKKPPELQEPIVATLPATRQFQGFDLDLKRKTSVISKRVHLFF